MFGNAFFSNGILISSGHIDLNRIREQPPHPKNSLAPSILTLFLKETLVCIDMAKILPKD